MDERIPVVGVDYPRTHQQLVAWFCPEEDCLEYLARLRWPGTRIRPASATAPGTPGSPPRGRPTPPAADACAGSPPPPPESARPYSKSTGLKQIPNTCVRIYPNRLTSDIEGSRAGDDDGRRARGAHQRPAGEPPRRRATGTAAQIYLGLWNHGTEITSAGRTDALDRWHRVQRVRWS